jgi:hypothetical protein
MFVYYKDTCNYQLYNGINTLKVCENYVTFNNRQRFAGI